MLWWLWGFMTVAGFTVAATILAFGLLSEAWEGNERWAWAASGGAFLVAGGLIFALVYLLRVVPR